MGNNYFCVCARSDEQAYVDDYFNSLLICKGNYLLDTKFLSNLKSLSNSNWDEFTNDYLKSDDSRYDLIHNEFWKSVPQYVYDYNFRLIAWSIIIMSNSSVKLKAETIREIDDGIVTLKRDKIILVMNPYLKLITMYANSVLNEKSKNGSKPRHLKDYNEFYQEKNRNLYLQKFLKKWELCSIDIVDFFNNIDDHSKIRQKMELLYSE